MLPEPPAPVTPCAGFRYDFLWMSRRLGGGPLTRPYGRA